MPFLAFALLHWSPLIYRFAPPPRFTAVSFGENVGPFEHDSLRKGSGKELWAVRIPEGVSVASF